MVNNTQTYLAPGLKSGLELIKRGGSNSHNPRPRFRAFGQKFPVQKSPQNNNQIKRPTSIAKGV